jgi:hypothetical protein
MKLVTASPVAQITSVTVSVGRVTCIRTCTDYHVVVIRVTEVVAYSCNQARELSSKALTQNLISLLWPALTNSNTDAEIVGSGYQHFLLMPSPCKFPVSSELIWKRVIHCKGWKGRFI